MLLLAGRSQLGWQLGREQVHLGFEAEPALAVDDDFLDGRAMPGGFLNGGNADLLLPVVGGQRAGVRVILPDAWVPSTASAMQSRSTGFLQQRGKRRMAGQPSGLPGAEPAAA